MQRIKRHEKELVGIILFGINSAWWVIFFGLGQGNLLDWQAYFLVVYLLVMFPMNAVIIVLGWWYERGTSSLQDMPQPQVPLKAQCPACKTIYSTFLTVCTECGTAISA